MEKQEFDKLIESNGSKNLGWKTFRLSEDFYNDREIALSEHWQKENIKNTGINFGQGILQDNFCEHKGHPFSIGGDVMHLKINNRDRFIVATIIQWLGTNVGFCWLQEAFKKAGYSITKNKE